MGILPYLLIVGFNDAGGAPTKLLTPMPSMEMCIKAVDATKIAGATGGDAQAVVVVTCITGDPLDRSQCIDITPDKNGYGEHHEIWPCQYKRKP